MGMVPDAYRERYFTPPLPAFSGKRALSGGAGTQGARVLRAECAGSGGTMSGMDVISHCQNL